MGETDLPVLLGNLEAIWGKSKDTRRRYLMEALVLDEAVRVTGADNLQYDIVLVSALFKNGALLVTKELA